MKFCTHREGNPGNLLQTRRNPLLNIFISVSSNLPSIFSLRSFVSLFIADKLQINAFVPKIDGSYEL